MISVPPPKGAAEGAKKGAEVGLAPIDICVCVFPGQKVGPIGQKVRPIGSDLPNLLSMPGVNTKFAQNFVAVDCFGLGMD